MNDYQRIKGSFEATGVPCEQYRTEVPRWLIERGLVEHAGQADVLELFATNRLLFDDEGRYLGALSGEEIEVFVPEGEDAYYTESSGVPPRVPTQEEIGRLASAMSVDLGVWSQQ